MNAELIFDILKRYINLQGKNPSVVIMHPDVYEMFVTRVTNRPDGLIMQPTLHGIEVLRSPDVRTDEIRMY